MFSYNFVLKIVVSYNDIVAMHLLRYFKVHNYSHQNDVSYYQICQQLTKRDASGCDAILIVVTKGKNAVLTEWRLSTCRVW